MSILIRTSAILLICATIIFESLTSLALAASALDYKSWTYFDINLVAMQLKKDGNYKVALDLFSLAVSIKPLYPEAYIGRGSVYGLIHDREKAISDELQALTLVQGDKTIDRQYKSLAHAALAEIYTEFGENANAELELKVALKLCPDNPVHEEKLACLMAQKQQFKLALDYLKEAKIDYKNLNALSESARINEIILDLQNSNLLQTNIMRSIASVSPRAE